MEELANIGNCYYGIDSAGDFYFWIKGTHDSELLITNDVDNAILNNHNATRYSTLEGSPNWYDDSIVGGGYAFIHGLGYERIQSDDKFESADAAQDLNDFWVAFPFTPDRDNVATLAPFLAAFASPPAITDPLFIELV